MHEGRQVGRQVCGQAGMHAGCWVGGQAGEQAGAWAGRQAGKSEAITPYSLQPEYSMAKQG